MMAKHTTNQSIPVPALVLGLAGLIPFFSCAALIFWAAPQHDLVNLATLALGAYGAVILSFLGGVRWGSVLFDDASLKQWLPLIISVVPSLIAWPALLMPPVPMFAVLCAGFTLQYALDVAAGKQGALPAWFIRLRLMLSTGAILSLLAGLMGHAL